MKTYKYIDKIEAFENVQEFRKLYDDLVADEIKEEDVPDGELFRKKYVEINDGINTTHIGLGSEERIIEDLKISLMKLDRITKYFSKEKWNDHKLEAVLLNAMISINVFVKDNLTLESRDLVNYH